MGTYVLGFEEIGQSPVEVVGGKGAQLGGLWRIEGISVPAGFCVTADAFRRIMVEVPSVDQLLEQLSRLSSEDDEAIRTLSEGIRRSIEATTIPDDLAGAIARSVTGLGEGSACAVRSSATAEDLPSSSFAGQHDTFLNIVGTAEVLRHISRCWASLFTERAVVYRLQHGFDHRTAAMAVVVQAMVLPQVAGVLFTADPLTSNRKVVSVEASFGLGEALVDGRVNPDVYRVRGGEIVARTIGTKQFAVHAIPGGGTRELSIEPGRRSQPSLTDAQLLQLAELGRRIEAHFGRPQDIEWCLDHRGFQIVQSRPITTLFPIPAAGDDDNHVYVSVGHQQMMTDPMKPLGLSFWQLTTRRPMSEAGGRLFVDVTRMLGAPTGGSDLLEALGRSDPLIGDALQRLLDRGDFIPSFPDEGPGGPLAGGGPDPIEADPAVVTELIDGSRASIRALREEIKTRSGTALIDFIVADLQELRRILFDPRSLQVIMTAMRATWWLNEHLYEWLGEKDAADTLAQSVPDNVTSEMGLALLDVADAIRPHPEVVAFLQHVADDDFLADLAEVEGGQEARNAIRTFLDRYGMRGVGEIDITRPRWSERPTLLVPVILGNVRNFESGAGRLRFEQGLEEASTKEREVLQRLQTLPDGESKVEETRRMINRVRTFIGYREYPKYGMVSRYFIYKQALLDEAERQVQAGVLHEMEDLYFLRFEEFAEVVGSSHVDQDLISRRKEAFRWYGALTPPRVLTSDGEVVAGVYRGRDVPSGALVGLPVSAGTVEGRARVVADLAEADLEEGDILVTAYTDPSWSPLLVAVAGLVTEVGGLMTHGSVIAREYGVPAVVGVEQATGLISDGQRIRVHGTDGYVELLPTTPVDS